MESCKKKKGFEVKSRELTYEEKIERANDFNDFNGEFLIDPEEFAKETIYDSSVEMKCLECDFEDEIDFDDILQWLEINDEEEYPVFYCPNCDKESLIPKSIYKEIKKHN